MIAHNRLLSVQEFAEALGCKPACIRRWLLMRKIGYVKVGRLVRIPADEVSRIVQEGYHPPRSERTQ